MLFRHHLMSSLAVSAVIAVAAPVHAEAREGRSYDIPSQDLGSALRKFAQSSRLQVIFDGETTRGKRSEAIRSQASPEAALRDMLRGTGLTYRRDGKIFIITAAQNSTMMAVPVVLASAQQVAASVPSAASEYYNDIIVTAQKKAESIQDVPISVSAFSAEALDNYKIEGGSELLRAIPNVTFSKSNFASYNFSIRGIGTKALSVSSDPAVAIAFNNAPMIRNRLFEQEYFDVERVEVLRGPQGTLYGRNATGGVVNMITKLPVLQKFDGMLKAELGNYDTRRIGGMVNIPLGDSFAVRGSGAWTKRDGFDYNSVTNKRVNGRDLWSARLSAIWEPSDKFSVNAVWERFHEDDDRSRTGKQLCHRDDGPTQLGDLDISEMLVTRGMLSQGCLPKSLYDDAAFGVPNGLSLPYVLAAASVVQLGGIPGTGETLRMIDSETDPYATVVQSRNLREIATKYDPEFRAKNDVLQLNLKFKPSDSITIDSQTMYTRDRYLSRQDYNRFNSPDVFNSSSGLVEAVFGGPQPTEGFVQGGVFNDYQLGPSRSILGIDMVRSKSSQFYQEFRMQSDYSGPLNFNVGMNYLKFKIDEDYFVFNNLLTAIAIGVFGNGNLGGEIFDCATVELKDACVYVDKSSLDNLDGDGHNYFRSRNIGNTESYAAFGELYYNINDRLKLTAGLRFTSDKKTSTPVKSQLLLAPGDYGGGYVHRGYRFSPDIVQEWNRLNGRLVLDWKPDLRFADDSLFYVSYARGYKGGGANPPGIDANPERLQFFPQEELFKPETVNAFELGARTTMLNGAMNLNANAFYYDYTGYQVSQIVDRLALNENFDADIWGAELELAWAPSPRWRVNANLGFLKSRIDDGMKSIDVMNRTQGNPDWMVVKPWIQLASNCIAPREKVIQIMNANFFGIPLFTNVESLAALGPLCGGSYAGSYKPGSFGEMLTGVTYDPATDAPNNGRGFDAPLGGNELPNSPNWTFNLGVQRSVPIKDWALTLRGDYYRQGKSWARVYNTENDRLKAWDNFNLTMSVDRGDGNLSFQFYVKNLFNKTPITDSFINSDDSGLTTNIFTLDPRIFGFNVQSRF